MNQPVRIPEVSGGDAPVFAEPWEARAFAMVVSLHERGLYTWAEWADALATRISEDQADGGFDSGDTYYRQWLDALEDLLARNGIGSPEIERWRDAWQRAANRTAHGTPIELRADDFDPARDAGAKSR